MGPLLLSLSLSLSLVPAAILPREAHLPRLLACLSVRPSARESVITSDIRVRVEGAFSLRINRVKGRRAGPSRAEPPAHFFFPVEEKGD